MQDCTRCGHKNQDNSRFCGQCGDRLNNVCPSCSFPNMISQSFCGQCGKQLLEESEPAPVQHQSPQPTPSRQANRASQRLKSLKGRNGQPETSLPPPEPTPQMSVPLSVPPAPDASPRSEAPTPASQPDALTAEDTSHTELEADYQLSEYALISLELMNLADLSAASDDPSVVERFRRECRAYIDDRISSAGGVIESAKGIILFVSFKNEASTEESLEHAITMALGLLEEDFRLQDVKLKIRMGLDIERKADGPSITAVTERTVAQPDTLVISETVNEMLGARYDTTLIGPLPLGNRMVPFYQLKTVHTPPSMPSADSLLAEPPSPTMEMRPARPVEKRQANEQSIESSHLYPQRDSESAPEAQASYSEPIHEPTYDDSEPGAQAPEPTTGVSTLALFEGDPQPVYFNPPELLLHKATRDPNLDYERSLEALYTELYSLFNQPGGKGRVVSVSASDGLGRSNIIGMVRGRLDPGNEHAIWLGANNYRSFTGYPLPLCFWLEVLQNLLGLIPEGQPEAEVREVVEKFLRYLYDGELPPNLYAFLVIFLSVERLHPLEMDERDLLGQTEECLAEIVGRMAQKLPVILIVEDLDFMDPASQDVLLKLISKGLLEQRVGIILTHRKNLYLSGDLERLVKNYPYKELVISDLEPQGAERFLNDGPFGGNLSSLPFELLDELLANAKGSPLYLEEAARLLHLQGVLEVNDESGKFMYAGEPTLGPLPTSLHNVVNARMDFLSDSTRYLLHLASVLGEKFPVSLLFTLSQMEEEAFNETLTLLFEHGYFLPDAVNTGRFRHGGIWQAVYESLRADMRDQLHQLTSQALENDIRALTVNPALVAYHAERGGLINRAFNFWNLAGIHAAQSGSLTGMNMAMFHALALVVQTPENEAVALQIEENLGAFNAMAQPDLAESLLRNVILRYHEAGDSAGLLQALATLSACYEQRGEFLQALEVLDQSVAILSAAEYPLEAATLQMSRMEHLYTLGRLQKAREVMEREILPRAKSPEASQDADFADSLLQSRLLYAQILMEQFDPQSFNQIEDLLARANERGMEGLNIALQLIRAQGFLKKGMYQSCDRDAEGLLEQIEALEGSEWFLAQWGLLALGYHCDMGDWESARQLVLTVVTKAEHAHDYQTMVIAQTYAGRIAHGLGNYKEAKKLLEQALGKSSDYRFASVALLGWRWLAETELALGAREVAYEIASKALSIARKPEIRNHYEAAMLTNVCARCLLQLDDIKTAGKLLEEQWPRALQTKYAPLIADTAYWIGELYQKMAHDAPSELSRKHLERSVQFLTRSRTMWLEMKNQYRYQRVQEAMPQV